MEICPRCGAPLEGTNTCPLCGKVIDTEKHNEAEELFLSGSAYLSLGELEKAAEQFLGACTLSPTEPKNWLYLLAAITDKFRTVYLIGDERSTRKVGKKKVIYAYVYKNFTATANNDDYIFAKSEFGIDLDPRDEELWVEIVREIIALDSITLPLAKATELAHFAIRELKASHPQTAIRLFPALCRKLNPVREGVLEINTLEFFPDTPDRVLRFTTEADSIEFVSDSMDGSDRFDTLLLPTGIENIGTSYPLPELTLDTGYTAVPSKLLCFCPTVQIVNLPETLRIIGKNAFTECVNLRSVRPLDNVTEIRDGAFYGTGVRYLDVPSGVTRIGSEILGRRTEVSEHELASYLIKIDASLAKSSPDFNKIGHSRCGYLSRDNGKLSIVYPQRYVDGRLRPLAREDRIRFRELVYASIDGEDVKQSPLTAAKEAFESLLNRFSKTKKS